MAITKSDLFQIRMAAPGTIVLTLVDPAVPRDFRNHVYTTSLGGHFESSLCITSVPFIVHPNEGHVLITDLDQIFGAVLQTPDGRRSTLSVNEGQRPLQLCYSIRLKLPDMMLYVGRDSSLSLLLRCGCLQVTPFMATREQVTQLIRPPPPYDEQDQGNGWIPARPPTPCPSPTSDIYDDDDDDM
jgi:hypothetical protein